MKNVKKEVGEKTSYTSANVGDNSPVTMATVAGDANYLHLSSLALSLNHVSEDLGENHTEPRQVDK